MHLIHSHVAIRTLDLHPLTPGCMFGDNAAGKAGLIVQAKGDCSSS